MKISREMDKNLREWEYGGQVGLEVDCADLDLKFSLLVLMLLIMFDHVITSCLCLVFGHDKHSSMFQVAGQRSLLRSLTVTTLSVSESGGNWAGHYHLLLRYAHLSSVLRGESLLGQGGTVAFFTWCTSVQKVFRPLHCIHIMLQHHYEDKKIKFSLIDLKSISHNDNMETEFRYFPHRISGPQPEWPSGSGSPPLLRFSSDYWELGTFNAAAGFL